MIARLSDYALFKEEIKTRQADDHYQVVRDSHDLQELSVAFEIFTQESQQLRKLVDAKVDHEIFEEEVGNLQAHIEERSKSNLGTGPI